MYLYIVYWNFDIDFGFKMWVTSLYFLLLDIYTCELEIFCVCSSNNGSNLNCISSPFANTPSYNTFTNGYSTVECL